jgi:hypothetical protein
MPFVPYHVSRWLRGSTLVGTSDSIPDDALRLAQNVRLDRTLGAIEARPGWTRQNTNVFASAVVWLTKLFYTAATKGYVQIGTLLYRTDASFNAPTQVATVGTQGLSGANMPDGNGHIITYFVNATSAVYDDGNGTNPLPAMGVKPPTAAPTAAALATDLSTSIDTFEAGSAANWTGTGLSAGPADDAVQFQVGTGSVSFSIAASTFGNIARYLGASVNLDTLTNGDNLVKNDDYIFVWVRLDSPQNVTYIQLDVDIDAATTGVADAFRHNYYSIRLPALTRLSQGTNEWTKLQVRKSEFARYGTSTSVSWANARTFRIGFLTNRLGAIAVNVDDFKLRGGVGIEGTISYTVCYHNSTSAGRGNPPKDASGVTLYTAPLVVDRQRVNLTTTNVLIGGANNPGEGQDQMMIFRKGGIFPTAVLVDTVVTTAGTSPYLDHTSDATLVLTNKLLEIDNDPPPTATSTRVLFGPDASGHFFMIVDGFKLYIAKPYERLENRAGNWPADGFALVGDGSTKALAGAANSTQVKVWTDSLTYNVVGVGQDTFLPVALDGTRGIVGQYAVASGASLFFFVSQDGIYADSNGVQTKLTPSIDKFFQGQTVDGQLGWNTNPTLLAQTHLAYLHEPTGSVLVMTYADSNVGAINKWLVVKPNLENGQLSEIFFDSSATAFINSLYLDAVNRQLLAGGSDGFVYRIEDPTVFSDAGNAIVMLAREKSYDVGQPQRNKFVSHTEIEGNTHGQNLTVSAYYDRATTNELLGTMNTSTAVAVQQFPTADPTIGRHDVALQIQGSVTQQVTINRMGIYVEPQPEPLTFWDSAIESFDFVQQLKRFQIDMNIPANVAVKIYIDLIVQFTGTILATAGRTSFPYALPAGLRGRTFRVTLTSSGNPFLVYRLSGFFKQLGTDQDYTEKLLMHGV